MKKLSRSQPGVVVVRPTERSVSVRPMRAPKAQETCCDCLRNGATSSSKSSSAGDTVLVGLSPSPTEQRRNESPPTTCHPHPKPTRPGARDCQVQPALGISALCAAWPEGRTSRLCPQYHCEVNRRCEENNVVSTASCDPPNSKPSTTTSNRRCRWR